MILENIALTSTFQACSLQNAGRAFESAKQQGSLTRFHSALVFVTFILGFFVLFLFKIQTEAQLAKASQDRDALHEEGVRQKQLLLKLQGERLKLGPRSTADVEAALAKVLHQLKTSEDRGNLLKHVHNAPWAMAEYYSPAEIEAMYDLEVTSMPPSAANLYKLHQTENKLKKKQDSQRLKGRWASGRPESLDAY